MCRTSNGNIDKLIIEQIAAYRGQILSSNRAFSTGNTSIALERADWPENVAQFYFKIEHLQHHQFSQSEESQFLIRLALK
jgi:hypothetical protein